MKSGFCKYHSAEMALLKVTNDLLLAANSRACSVLGLLDLSAAFNSVDHRILLNRLRLWVGGQVQLWSGSPHISQVQMFCVAANSHMSHFTMMKHGVPQGSILGPLLFSLSMLPLGHVIQSHRVSFHFYADNTQLYFPVKTTDPGK